LNDLVDPHTCEQEVKKDVLKHPERRRDPKVQNHYKYLVHKVKREDYQLPSQAYR
jgi:hypothetical protein